MTCIWKWRRQPGSLTGPPSSVARAILKPCRHSLGEKSSATAPSALLTSPDANNQFFCWAVPSLLLLGKAFPGMTNANDVHIASYQSILSLCCWMPCHLQCMVECSTREFCVFFCMREKSSIRFWLFDYSIMTPKSWGEKWKLCSHWHRRPQSCAHTLAFPFAPELSIFTCCTRP